MRTALQRGHLEGTETAKAALSLLTAHLHLWLGLDALRTGNEEGEVRAKEAVTHLQRAAAVMPNHARLHAALARSYEAMGNEEDSRQEAAEALKLGAKPSDFEGFEKPPEKVVSVPSEEILETLQ
jgi:Flp pilus assembly protein TadD